MNPADPPAVDLHPGLVLRGFTPHSKRLADFRLIAFDMDSTLINIECIDEIAAAAGKRAEVSAITEAAMRGELDFRASLTRRVAALAGVPLAALDAIYRERLALNPGAAQLVQACQAAGLKVLLVSGGFTFFAERLRQRLGLDFVRSNQLAVAHDRLTGGLVPQCWGDICDHTEKRRTLLEVCSLIGCAPQQAIAVGDGANDLLMMGVAGLSVAFHAKPTVRAQAHVSIESGGLDRLLEVV